MKSLDEKPSPLPMTGNIWPREQNLIHTSEAISLGGKKSFFTVLANIFVNVSNQSVSVILKEMLQFFMESKISETILII